MKGLNETDTFIRHSHQAALRCEWDDLHRVLINSFSIWMVSSTAEQEENVKERMSVGVRDGEKDRERAQDVREHMLMCLVVCSSALMT